MGIIGAAFFPHPPIVLPGVGRGQEKAASATTEGMERLAALVAERKPQAIAVVTPHGPMFSDAVAVSGAAELTGTMEQFGAPKVRITKKTHLALLRAFETGAAGAGADVAVLEPETYKRTGVGPGLDHGALVPLYFIEKLFSDYSILHISPGGLPPKKQYLAGRALQRAAEAAGVSVLVLASGDLSHKLKDSGPYGYAEAGPRFDALFADAIRGGDPAAILAVDPALARKAGECGWRPAAFALGALDGMAVESRLLSYEGPFGVGYLTALLTPVAAGGAAVRYPEAARREFPERPGEDGYVRLARQAVERYVRTGREPAWAELKPAAGEAVQAMERVRAGSFVSMHMFGELRGCMGTIAPVCAHVGQEIIRNAVTACSEDPRFPPVEEDELADLEIKVDVLSPFEPVSSPAELDPARYGVIVDKGGRRGLLLPALEGVDSVESQLDIACRKAGFRWSAGDKGIQLYRFTVERHGEAD